MIIRSKIVPSIRLNKLKAAISELTQRKEKYIGFLKELIETGETQKLTTDPEARVMQS